MYSLVFTWQKSTSFDTLNGQMNPCSTFKLTSQLLVYYSEHYQYPLQQNIKISLIFFKHWRKLDVG